MPRPLPTIPFETADAATLGPVLKEMDDRELFADLNDPARWTLDLIGRQQRGELSHRQAAAAQRYLFAALMIPNKWTLWATLNATDVLASVNTKLLTLDCLRDLIRTAGILHQGTFGHRWRNAAEMATEVAARKSALSVYGTTCATTFGVFLDRATQQLTPFLTPP